MLRGARLWEVEAILDERKSTRWRGQTEYLIKWKGYTHNDNTWEPESGIACGSLVEAFKAKRRRELATAQITDKHASTLQAKKSKTKQETSKQSKKPSPEKQQPVTKTKRASTKDNATPAKRRRRASPASDDDEPQISGKKTVVKASPTIVKTSPRPSVVKSSPKTLTVKSPPQSSTLKTSPKTVVNSSQASAKGVSPKQTKKSSKLCSVCRDPDENFVISCSKCGVEVHPGCYGVQQVPPEWKCSVCKYLVTHPKVSPDSIRCVLCPSPVGALKPTDDNRWVHSSCALWIPETSFGDNETLEPVLGLKEIPQERLDLVCSLCNKSGYCCIQCDFDDCCESFHVTCAQDAGLNVKIVPEKQSTALTVLAYCHTHGLL